MADLISINGGRGNTPTDQDQKIPVNNYEVYTMNERSYRARGFCIFTSHHIAIMRDDGEGAVPILVVPLTNVEAVGLIEDDDEVQEELL